MATTKKASSKSKQIDDNRIIALYMDAVLSDNAVPKNIYLFCKAHQIEESDFYSFFGSFENLKQASEQLNDLMRIASRSPSSLIWGEPPARIQLPANTGTTGVQK
jgi:hypothetical protein